MKLTDEQRARIKSAMIDADTPDKDHCTMLAAGMRELAAIWRPEINRRGKYDFSVMQAVSVLEFLADDLGAK